jgi:glutathione S-transferase
MNELFIGNKTYSSWSLRPWVLMKALNIEFTERPMRFGGSTNFEAFRKFSPSGRVPCLVHDGQPVWDSLAIIEYLAERHPGVWPTDVTARTWARCAAAEMHSGFAALRETASMCCGVRIQLTKRSAAFEADLARINELWSEGVTKFGGPFLAGRSFTAVDAMFAPVAFRMQTYGLELSGAGATVTQTLLGLGAMKQWYAEAVAENFRDAGHEADLTKFGTLLEDLRARG